jgi:hypothetical protein
MKKAIVCIMAFTCLFSFAGSLTAYDDLFLDTSEVSDPKELNLDAYLVYRTASKTFDQDGDKVDADATNIRIPLSARFGIIDNLSGLAVLPIVSAKNGDSETGIGDAWIGLKYRLMQERPLIARLALNLPTGDDDKGLGNPGGVGVDLGVMCAGRMITDTIGIGWQAGLRFVTEDSDTKWKPGMMFYALPGVYYIVREGLMVSGGLEFMTGADGQMDGTDVDDSGITSIEPWIGVRQRFTEDLDIIISIGNVVSGKNVSNNMDFYINLSKDINF